MEIKIIYEIKKNQNCLKYLHDHSYWYKYLNRDANYYKNFITEMKKEYKLTIEDRIEKFSGAIDSISKIIDILN